VLSGRGGLIIVGASRAGEPKIRQSVDGMQAALRDRLTDAQRYV
jgi:hypothetical protein